MFETSTWSKVWEEQLSTSCLDVEFSPDGRQVAAAGFGTEMMVILLKFSMRQQVQS